MVTIEWVRGKAPRAEAEAYLAANHYMRSSGGTGALFAVRRHEEIKGACLIGGTVSEVQKRSLVGACLIGPTASADANRNLAGPGVAIRAIKRSHLADDLPVDEMRESQLLRHAMERFTDAQGRPILFVSYADPAAVDERTGLPLAGWTYLASGFFYAGETTSQRWCVIDHLGRARSTRQGKRTLTRRTLPRAGQVFNGELVTADWQMRRLPPARIWLAVETPTSWSRRRSKVAWRYVWAQLAPGRRLAAKQWVNLVELGRKVAGGLELLGPPRPHQVRDHEVMQPAWWPGSELHRTAAPVWAPFTWQQRLLLEEAVAGERTGGRAYEPLLEV